MRKIEITSKEIALNVGTAEKPDYKGEGAVVEVSEATADALIQAGHAKATTKKRNSEGGLIDGCK